MSNIEASPSCYIADELDNEKQFDDELDVEDDNSDSCDDDRSKRSAGVYWWNRKKFSHQLESFERQCDLIAEYIVNYNNTIEQRKVAPAMKPGYLRPKFAKRGLQDKPKNVEYLMNSFDKRIMPGICHWKHPLFLAYFPAGGAYSQVLGDMLSTGCGGVGATWAQQPALTELECVMMDWLAQALNLPDHFKFENPNAHSHHLHGGGMTVGSASDAIHNVLLAARYNYLHDRPSVHLEDLVAFTSSQTHSSTVKAAQLALVYMKLLCPEKGDKSGTITGVIFQEALRREPKHPFFMCASVGTTGGCAIDDVQAIGEVCRAKDIYLHVDAAYAGSAFVSPKFKDLLKGLEYADSLDVNPYKFMLASPDLACLWVRNMKKFAKAFDPNDGLVKYKEHHNQPKYLINFQSFGIPATRRMRALKLWALFQNYGRVGLAEYIERLSECASYFENLVNRNSKYETLNVRRLALVCFRQADQQQNRSGKPEKEDTIVDKQNRNLITRLNATNEMHIVGSYFDANYGLRFSVNYEYITHAHIDQAWNLIQDNYVTKLDADYNKGTRSSPTEMQAILDRNNYFFVSPEEFVRLRDTNTLNADGFGRVPIPRDESSVNMLSFFAKKLADEVRQQEAAMDAAIEKDEKDQKDNKGSKDSKDSKAKKDARKGKPAVLTDDEDEYSYDDD